jgi:HEAT repeat protein
MKQRRAAQVVLAMLLLAGLGLVIPGSPAYAPPLVAHYATFQEGHSLGYWLRALRSQDEDVRHQAIFALGAIGPGAAEAVPTLAAIVADDPDVEARHCAALALAKMGPASRPAVPALAKALATDGEPAVRMNAVLALFTLGEASRPAVPVLIAALKRRANRTDLKTFTFTIQEMAALALGRATAGTAEGVPALTQALERARTARMRRLLARALAEVGPPAGAAEPRLRTLLHDENAEVRQAAKDALERIAGG